MLFNLLVDEAYYSRPIPLRHVLVFYGGIIQVQHAEARVAQRSIDNRLEALFPRVIDRPGHTAAAV